FSLKKLWQFVGPGLLVSQALLDPGNIESDISQADTSGYQLLWLLLLAHIMCIFVQCLAARLGVITGRHLAQHIRMQYPWPYAVVFWLLSELAIIGADIQEVVGTATALHILTRIPLWAGVVITAVDSFLFLYVQKLGVRVTELVFGLLITTLAVCFWVEMVLIKPDVKQMFKGMFVPLIPQGSVVQAVGIIGCVLMPHNLYLHSALVGSRKLERCTETREGAIREAMRYFRIETSISLIYAYLINMAVVVVFCKAFIILRESGTPYVASLADGATILSNVLGSGSKYVYAIGLLAIGQSTTMSGTLSGQYVTEGFWNMPVKPWQRVVITRAISLVPALVVALTAAAHMDLLSEIINVIQAIVLSFTIIPLLKLQAHAEVVGHEF
ncbi:NRAMP family, partial [Coemansia spiralis]